MFYQRHQLAIESAVSSDEWQNRYIFFAAFSVLRLTASARAVVLMGIFTNASFLWKVLLRLGVPPANLHQRVLRLKTVGQHL